MGAMHQQEADLMLQHAYILVSDLAGDTGGVTPPKYALIASGIALAILTAITALGASDAPNYDDVNAAMNRA